MLETTCQDCKHNWMSPPIKVPVCDYDGVEWGQLSSYAVCTYATQVNYNNFWLCKYKVTPRFFSKVCVHNFRQPAIHLSGGYFTQWGLILLLVKVWWGDKGFGPKGINVDQLEWIPAQYKNSAPLCICTDPIHMWNIYIFYYVSDQNAMYLVAFLTMSQCYKDIDYV